MRAFAIALPAAFGVACGGAVPLPPSIGSGPPPAASAPSRGLPPAPVRFLVGGDSRDDTAHVIPWAFREAHARGAVAFFFLGDMMLSPELDRWFADELAELDPIAFYPVLGNHEIRQIGLLKLNQDGAERMFAHRFLGNERTPVRSSVPGKVVYSVDLPGGVHLVALDNVSQRGFGPEQLAWLEADLARARSEPATRYVVVGMHKPLAHNGLTDHSMDADGAQAAADSDAALALFVRSHVDALFLSHLHQYSEFRQAGIRAFITGGLGAPLTSAGPEHAFHHFLQVDATSDGLNVQVVKFPGALAAAQVDEDEARE